MKSIKIALIKEAEHSEPKKIHNLVLVLQVIKEETKENNEFNSFFFKQKNAVIFSLCAKTPNSFLKFRFTVNN